MGNAQTDAPEVGGPDETIEILDGPSIDPVDGETSYEQVFHFLKTNGDIILTIDEADEEELRRGLSVVKHNYNLKLKKDNVPQDTRQIAFKIIERLPDTEPQQIRLQVWFRKKSSVVVHRLVVSDKDL